MVWNEGDEIRARETARERQTPPVLRPTNIGEVSWEVTYTEIPLMDRDSITSQNGLYTVKHSKCNGFYSSGDPIPGSISIYAEVCPEEPEFNHLPEALHYSCRDCGKQIPKEVKFIILMDQAGRKL